MQSFNKIGIKLYEELRSRGTHCLYIEVVHEVEKVTKNNLTIISKPHAHPHTMKKTHTPRVNVDGWTDGQTDRNLHA